jgi:hypothetical protein
MTKQKLSHDRQREIAEQLAALGQDLINGRKPENYNEIPKRQVLAALIIAYTGKTVDFNVRRLVGEPAKEPPYLQTIIDEICELFDYHEP